jgi:putative peptidoglycan lipid II flippase
MSDSHPPSTLSRQVVWVACLLLLAKTIGAIKEALLAKAYGTGALMDAYQFTHQMASWPVSIFLAIVSAALVPAYATLQTQSPPQFKRFRAQVHGATLALALMLSLAWVLVSLQSPLLNAWSGLSESAQQHAAQLVLPMTWLIACGIYGALLMAECISGQHQISTLSESTPAWVLGSLLWMTTTPGINTLVVGTIGGAVLQVMVLATCTAWYMRLPLPSARWQHPAWPPMLAALGTLLLAQVLQAATSVIDQFWAARAGQGAVAVMGYANRLLFLVLGLGSVAIVRVLLPTLARLTAAQRQHHDQARQLAQMWAWRVFGLSTISLLALWPLAPWLVATLFERGAFGPADTQRVAAFLQVSWLQVPSTLASLVLIQQVLAEQQYRLLTWLAAANLLVKLLGNSLLAPWLGLQGLALASALMPVSTLLVLLLWWRKAPHKSKHAN